MHDRGNEALPTSWSLAEDKQIKAFSARLRLSVSSVPLEHKGEENFCNQSEGLPRSSWSDDRFKTALYP